MVAVITAILAGSAAGAAGSAPIQPLTTGGISRRRCDRPGNICCPGALPAGMSASVAATDGRGGNGAIWACMLSRRRSGDLDHLCRQRPRGRWGPRWCGLVCVLHEAPLIWRANLRWHRVPGNAHPLIRNARVTCMRDNVVPLERGLEEEEAAPLWRALADPTRRPPARPTSAAAFAAGPRSGSATVLVRACGW